MIECEVKQEVPRLAVRRWGDEWFHVVQAQVPEGYIVEGFLFPREDVFEIMDLSSGQVNRHCAPCAGESD